MHPELVLCTVEGLGKHKALNLCPAFVKKFYDPLSSAYDKHSYEANHITVMKQVYRQGGIVACG